MNPSVIKNSIREIRDSFGRFAAIFAIIALGVALFVGLRMSRPDFLETFNRYIDECNFYDWRLVSTLGLTQEDVTEVKKLEGVLDAEGVVSADFMYESADGEDLIIVAETIPERINTIDVIEGRMPTKGSECLADPNMYTEDDIGKKIKLSENNSEQTFDTFAYDEYTIVGLTESISYINLERGSSTLGNGSVEGYVYLLPEGFSVDYYTDIYVTVEADGYVYSDEYEQAAAKYEKPLEKFMEERAVIRFDSIIDEATTQLEDAKQQYESGLAEYTPAYEEYLKGEEEFKKSKAETEKQLEDSLKQLEETEKLLSSTDELEAQEAELLAAKKQLDAGYEEYEDGLRKFELKKALSLDTVNKQIDYYTQKQSETQAELSALQTEHAQLEIELAQAEAEGRRLKAATLRSQIERNEDEQQDAQDDLQKIKSRLAEHMSSKQEAEAELQPYQDELDAAKAELDKNYAQVNSGLAQIQQAKSDIAGAKQQLEEGWKQYESGKAAAEEGFKQAEAELKSAKTQLDEAKRQLDDAKRQLDAAEKQIKNMEHADVYVLGRDTNIGYVCFESDTEVVDSVAGVFPVFFFLVAALVCLTTMTRMVGDQRTQIGIMKALGYSSGTIAAKYLFYSGSATALGCVFGIGIGAILFPGIIWFGYGIMYSFSSLVFTMDWGFALIITGANLVVMLAVTWLCCMSELKSVPAELIRPKAPEGGKRVILEHITFIWNKMSFMQKVSVRNVLRYKKRIFMMLLGIGGCTALVLTAFGLNDTIKNIVSHQYNEICLYDYELTLAYDMTPEEQEIFFADCGSDCADAMFMYRCSADLSGNGSTKSLTLTALADNSTEGFLDLHKGAEPVALPGKNEVVINSNLARMLELKVGDEVRIVNGDMETLNVTVSGIFDNYIQNYAYVSVETCREQWGRDIELKSALVNAPDDTDVYKAATRLAEVDGVRSISLSLDESDRITNMMSSIKYIVGLIIICAGLLAFIVLYNLTNINISERIREIATIKVLGFYPREAAQYVFRENLVLTGAGALVGLALGVWLHAFIMNEITIDMMYFEPNIDALSFVLSIVMTYVFAFIVNLIMRRRIDNIDMAGALKSIE